MEAFAVWTLKIREFLDFDRGICVTHGTAVRIRVIARVDDLNRRGGFQHLIGTGDDDEHSTENDDSNRDQALALGTLLHLFAAGLPLTDYFFRGHEDSLMNINYLAA